MWEKIVLNLLSNAFKFTFAGEIGVRLQWRSDHVELVIQDTGIGIPEAEMPHLFERFHRVKGAQGRSFEGSGIGLSLVHELVKLHGGNIDVVSVEGQGTCFTISILTGTAHLPPDQIRDTRRTLAAVGAAAFVEEALRWLPEPQSPREDVEAIALKAKVQSSNLIHAPSESTEISQTGSQGLARILLADDNTDMRDYVKRLLSHRYEVEAVTNGLAALEAIRRHPPDLVLTDVMMPGLDGFGLLRSLRNPSPENPLERDPRIQDIPVILLSARAGEESRIEGLEAGADDYLIKPFSARELLARVEATLKLSRLRQEATYREQGLRAEAEAVRIRLESVLSGIKDQFIVLDREWRYTFVNEQVLEVTGKRQEELLGKVVWDVFPDVLGSLFETEVHRAVTEQSVSRFELFYPQYQRWFENRVYPFAEGVTIFVTDVSDRKRAEAERDRLLQLEQAARSAAEHANRIKDEFLAVLSHELRSPLNPILGWSKLLQQRKLDEAATQRALETIERNAKLQTQLIEDLLDVSRILRGKMTLTVSPVNLITAVQAAIETVRLAAEAKQIIIQTQLAENIAPIAGDAARIQQIVWNLLSNAIKFTPAGGKVEVCLESVGNQAQIQVKDTGKGINPAFLPYVFEYFRQEDGTTTRKFGGLGLGLAIVRHLTELHGGTVSAESPGENLGATFTVRIPLNQGTIASPRISALDSPEVDLRGLKVLVVDDEADMRDLLAFILKQRQAQVQVSNSASEALAAFETFQPDLLISDIGMPIMDGYTLMQQVRLRSPEQGGQIPAIALTAYAGELDQKQALAVGFQQHLAKPVEPDDLIQTIVTLLNKRPAT